MKNFFLTIWFHEFFFAWTFLNFLARSVKPTPVHLKKNVNFRPDFPNFFLILYHTHRTYLDNVRKVPDEGRSWITLPKMLTILLVNFWPFALFKLSKAGSKRFIKSDGCWSYRIKIRSTGFLNKIQAGVSETSQEDASPDWVRLL